MVYICRTATNPNEQLKNVPEGTLIDNTITGCRTNVDYIKDFYLCSHKTIIVSFFN